MHTDVRYLGNAGAITGDQLPILKGTRGIKATQIYTQNT